jgi:subtilisin family serine protease
MGVNRWMALFLFVPAVSFAQDRYFVSFKDKTNTTYTVSNPLQFLSQKSIDRRKKENFAAANGFYATEEDLPVDAAYVSQVKTTGAKVFYASRWFNGVLVQTDATTAASIVALACVNKVELVAPGSKLVGGRVAAKQKKEQVKQAQELQNFHQLQMIGLDQMHAAGYHGEGIDIAVFDDGFKGVNTLPGFQPLFNESRVKAVFNFVNNSTDIYSADDHGTSTLSILAGNLPGTFLGSAYKANFFLYQTEDVTTEYRVEEYNWAFAAEQADSAGVDVISSSLGYNQFDSPSMDYTYANLDGKTAIISQTARKAVLRGIAVVNSAGNEGDLAWKYIDAPADAEGVIAVGAVDAWGKHSLFSSVGPTADGRIKPDVCAMGSSDVLFTVNGCCSIGDGTSFACPLVAGLVADMRQMLPQSSVADIYDRLVKASSQYNNPDSVLGYGIPNFKWTEITPPTSGAVEIFPNPVKDELKILFKEVNGQSFEISVYNSTGECVLNLTELINWNNNPYLINFLPLSNGLYFVKVKTQHSVETKKVIRIN